MKILDAGTEQLSNQDVLKWIGQKRQQITKEEQAIVDARPGPPSTKPRQFGDLTTQPRNFINSLVRHQRVLDAQIYPYTQNRTVYHREADEYAPMTELDKQVCEQIVYPVEAKYKNWKAQGMKKREMEKKLHEEQEAKSLTTSELLMLLNHAPASVSLMEPMIENAEERFTAEEKETLFNIVQNVLRPDEQKKKADGTG